MKMSYPRNTLPSSVSVSLCFTRKSCFYPHFCCSRRSCANYLRWRSKWSRWHLANRRRIRRCILVWASWGSCIVMCDMHLRGEKKQLWVRDCIVVCGKQNNKTHATARRILKMMLHLMNSQGLGWDILTIRRSSPGPWEDFPTVEKRHLSNLITLRNLLISLLRWDHNNQGATRATLTTSAAK